MPTIHYIKVQVPDNFNPSTDRVDPNNAYGEVQAEQAPKWSAYNANPFQAIKQLASDAEWATVVGLLCDTPDWTAIYPNGALLDDLLEQILETTGISCQFKDHLGWRACKDD